MQYNNKYVGLAYCRAEIYAATVACCPVVSHGEYALVCEYVYTVCKRWERQTDGRTPDRYITLTERRV